MFSKMLQMIRMSLVSLGTVLGIMMGLVVSVLFFPPWSIVILAPLGAVLGAFMHELLKAA